MAGEQAKPIETTSEHKFARDIIRYVLRDYMTGIHWKPYGIFEEVDVDSPFTPKLRNAVREELEFDGFMLHKVFDEYFPVKSLLDNKFKEVCSRRQKRFTAEVFEIKSFISFSILLAFYAGLSYHYGGTTGPFVSYKMIVETVRELKNLRKIDENFWNEMQNWLENNTEPRRQWNTVFQ